MKNALLNSDQSKNIKKMLLCAVTATVMLTTMIFTGNVLAASNKSYVAEGTDSSVTEVSSDGYFYDDMFLKFPAGQIPDGYLAPYPGTQNANLKKYPSNRADGCEMLPCIEMVQKVFRTQEEAAKDFTATYGLLAIRTNQDFSTTIYKIGNNAYSYKYAIADKIESGRLGTGCLPDRNIIAGDAVIFANDRSKSKATTVQIHKASEMGYYQGVTVPVYVTTPKGELKKAAPSLKHDPDYYKSFGYIVFAHMFQKNNTISTGFKHYKWDASQLFKFKHWGRKRCGSCA